MIETLVDLNFKKVLMEGIQELVFIMRVGQQSECYYEFLNSAAMEKTGLTESVIGKTFRDVFSPEMAQFLSEQYEKVINSLESLKYEDSYKPPLGERYSMETTLTPILNEKKECTHIITIVHDITDKKWAEFELKEYWKKLNESNQRYRSLLHFNPNGVLTLDETGNIISGNASAEMITGYKVNELIHKNFLSLLNMDDVNAVHSYLFQALKGEAVNLQIAFKKKTGETIELLLSYAPIVVNSEVIGVYAILRDFTETIRLTEKYEESEQRFRIIAEHAQDLISLLDEKGRVIYASPSHEKILGFGHDHYINKFFFHNVHEEDMYIFEKTITESIKSSQPCKLQIRKKHREKGWVWHELQGTPVYNNQNQFVHMVCVSRDIQSQKDYELKLQHFAYYDSLTNLPNRRFFKEELTQALTNFQQNSDGQLALIMMDIDHFKSINDTMGHDVGDAVMAEFGKRIRNSIRKIDLVARLGGDEFAVLIPNFNSIEQLVAIAERIERAMHLTWKIDDQHIVAVTTSMGIALAPREGATVSAMLKRADEALYEVKKAGRDSYKIR